MMNTNRNRLPRRQYAFYGGNLIVFCTVITLILMFNQNGISSAYAYQTLVTRTPTPTETEILLTRDAISGSGGRRTPVPNPTADPCQFGECPEPGPGGSTPVPIPTTEPCQFGECPEPGPGGSTPVPIPTTDPCQFGECPEPGPGGLYDIELIDLCGGWSVCADPELNDLFNGFIEVGSSFVEPFLENMQELSEPK